MTRGSLAIAAAVILLAAGCGSSTHSASAPVHQHKGTALHWSRIGGKQWRRELQREKWRALVLSVPKSSAQCQPRELLVLRWCGPHANVRH